MRLLAIGLAAALTACGAPEVSESAKELAEKDSIIEELEREIDQLKSDQFSGTLTPCNSLSRILLGLDSDNQIRTETKFDAIFSQRREMFGPLANLVGGCYRGAPADGSTEDNPDTQSWQWALGGTAILIKHALADGSYGGDTYVYKDAKTGELAYVYITNAGFRTEGVMVVNEDGSYTAEEAVEGHPSITKVRSTSVLNDDGSSSMTSEYLDDGEWKAGHAFIYSPTTEPLPQLKAPAN